MQQQITTTTTRKLGSQPSNRASKTLTRQAIPSKGSISNLSFSSPTQKTRTRKSINHSTPKTRLDRSIIRSFVTFSSLRSSVMEGPVGGLGTQGGEVS